MAQLYREVVLKEKPATSNEGGFIPLGAIAGAKASIAPANGNGTSDLKKTKKWANRWPETNFRSLQGVKVGPLERAAFCFEHSSGDTKPRLVGIG